MTERKATYRSRRTATRSKAIDYSALPAEAAEYLRNFSVAREEWRGIDHVPEDMQEWFGGSGEGACWSALLPPTCHCVRHYWALYVKDHPGATPPAYMQEVLNREP
jgi:hypothetical protein